MVVFCALVLGIILTFIQNTVIIVSCEHFDIMIIEWQAVKRLSLSESIRGVF